jgi:predicted flap endonuclease-1-like 5' DNA nuclease
MKLTVIEGIGPEFERKLHDAGISSIENLLENGRTPAGRKKIAEDSGIADSKVLTWVNHADLMRIKGIGGEFSELLEAAGVDTVPELAQRNAENLAAKMKEINDEKKLTRVVPSADTVAGWVAQAKELPRAIEY